MRVPFSWLKEFSDFTASPEEVADRLTMIGLEVEGTESSEGDIIFEVNVTPNRPDCLSVLGIARELSAMMGTPLKIPPHHIDDSQPASDYSVEILDPYLCNRYTGRVITGIMISDSPGWIQKRLAQCGIRAINNIVDITNYVLLELGHPLHAFDADLLAGKKVKVGTPSSIRGQREKIKMQTLDGAEREIPHDSLLIWDAERPVAVAGVMGGLNTEVTSQTRNIFLESAYFDPGSVRKTSKTLGLISESSYRFERGTDIVFLEKALDRAARLMREVGGGTIHKMIDKYPVRYAANPITVRPERIRSMLGIKCENANMMAILRGLGITAQEDGEHIVVHPPAHRRDIIRECDISEEIARMCGYDKIPTTVPRCPLSSGRLNRKSRYLQRIRDAMRKAGFSAVINYSFMNMQALDTLGIPHSDSRRDAVVISNPLSQDEALLRTTLAPALVANLRYNLDRGNREIRLFEISSAFEKSANRLPCEKSMLGGVWYKEKSPTLWKEDASGFYLTKGAIETIFEEFKYRVYGFTPSSEPFLHAGQSADIIVAGSCVGYVGALSPQILTELDLKRQRPDIILFEIDLDILFSHLPASLHFSPLAKYPSVQRDISLVLDEAMPSSTIREIITSLSIPVIEEVSIFDYFKGGNIPAGKKSLAFNIIYRAPDRTLTDEEVENLHAKVVKKVLEKTGGELRS